MSGIDVHTHLAPRLVQAGNLPGIERSDDVIVVDGRTIGPQALYEPEALDKHIRDHGLNAALVSLPPVFDRPALAASDSETWVAAANQGLLAAVGDSAVLRPLACLPLHHPELAVREYRRRRREARWAGVSASVGLTTMSLADSAYRPLWEVLNDDGVTLFLHPGASSDPRLGEFYLGNLLGNPFETGLAAAQLILGGVVERFPRIRIALAHCGGVLPAVIGRLQRGFETTRPGVPTAGAGPRDLCRNLWVDTVAFDESLIEHAADVFGIDRLVVGTDWPFAMGPDDPYSVLGRLDRAAREQVAVDNALRLLGQPVP